jgi:hypothetical protein
MVVIRAVTGLNSLKSSLGYLDDWNRETCQRFVGTSLKAIVWDTACDLERYVVAPSTITMQLVTGCRMHLCLACSFVKFGLSHSTRFEKLE